ncbi:MAG: beta-ketoacyl-[acyl-carrier-protein] synthase family protein [Desulfobacterota bacterium]|jgi:3-oxoacyl-[acyl-carrier-protein] synthase II|nr:beta-ketoacyl-[acyl-carrier-protein] synthase family protein [Thermodesulfobacteriota bacterium]
MRKRVVITGWGVISAIGQNPDEFWKSCLEAKTRVERIPEHWLQYGDFHSQISSPLPAIDSSRYGIGRIEEKQLDCSSLIAVACAFQALDSAGLEYTLLDHKRNTYSIPSLDQERTGVFMGTGIGGLSTFASCYSYQVLLRQKEQLAKAIGQLGDHPVREILQQAHDRMLHPRRFNPFAVSMTMPNACSANVGIKFNLRGSNNSYSAACASGTVAIGYGFKAVRAGELDAALVGGVEFLRDDYGGVFMGFDAVRALALDNDHPDKANRPFDKDRTGFLFSEGGGAVLVIEDLERARKRGAKILAEIIGYGETCDGFNIMMMESSGAQITRMLRLAFADAGITAEEIDYINAHGTGTRLNDETETAVIEQVFRKDVLINSTKSLIGHTLGASGAIEALVTALSIVHQTTHVCRNLDHPMKDLNFVTQVASYPIRTGLSQSFGFGGHNAALILREYR